MDRHFHPGAARNVSGCRFGRETEVAGDEEPSEHPAAIATARLASVARCDVEIGMHDVRAAGAGASDYAGGMLRRVPRAVRVVVELVAVTLLWRVLGSDSWLVDVGFAVWIILVVEGIQWFDRRRKGQSAAG
ncbi:MAG TPA: hypothetical protein VIM27_10725 [Gaiellales bacterium]